MAGDPFFIANAANIGGTIVTQAIFVGVIEKLIGNRARGTWLTVPGFHGTD